MASVTDSVTLDEIKRARELVADVARDTQVIESRYLSRTTGGVIALKAENLQRTGSFKVRGAVNKLSTLDDAQRAAGLIAASAWAWLPAEAAITPFLHPSWPSASSFAATPRTLNDPVRCRFSAFNATVPPARSENVRVESIGVRRATVSTAARAALTSRAVTVTAR